MYPRLILKPGKERSLRNFHPWIFSGAVAKTDKNVVDGALVDLYSSDEVFLARGFYNNGSIVARVISFTEVPIDQQFWNTKIEKAFRLRKQLGLTDSATIDCYRLVHGEGDGLPGLIIDIYKNTAVIQTHNLGMHLVKEAIKTAIQTVYGAKITCIYDKSSDTMPKIPGLELQNGPMLGDNTSTEVLEHGNRFHIDFVEGQKTGFFIDQRENRQLFGQYSKGKTVLNTFCYSGGFSVYALAAGATQVDSMDYSKKAIELTEQNVALNKYSNHQSYVGDAFDFFKNMEKVYDVIVLDPPAFAKHMSALKNATQGYQRLNRAAFEKIAQGGILFTFSCSQVVDKDLFRKVVFAAAAQAGRTVRILHFLSQPPDHPISIYHPEGEYLKGLVLHVE